MTGQSGEVIGVGMLGMGSMGRAHSSAFRRIAQVRPGVEPRLLALACRSAEKGQAFANRFGFAAWWERWEDLADPEFPFRWRSDAEQAGSGVLGDLGSHVVDSAVSRR